MKGKSRRSYTTLLMSVVMTALISITAVKAEAAPEVSEKEDGGHTVTFTYTNENAKNVYVGGDFTGYAVNDPAWKLTKNEEGAWELTADMASGVWQYRFVVDGVWTEDPENDTYGIDGQSSKLVVPGTVKSPIINGDSVTFNYPVSMVPEDAVKVVLKGEFNNWAEQDMYLSADGTHYTCTINGLAADTYEYGVCVYTFDDQRRPCASFCGDYYNMHAACHGGNSIFTIPSAVSAPVQSDITSNTESVAGANNTGNVPAVNPQTQPVYNQPVYTPPAYNPPTYTQPSYYYGGGCHGGWYSSGYGHHRGHCH